MKNFLFPFSFFLFSGCDTSPEPAVMMARIAVLIIVYAAGMILREWIRGGDGR